MRGCFASRFTRDGSLESKQLNTEARSQVHQALLSRCHAIADHWYQAIARTSHVPHSAAEVRQRLVELTEQTIALLFTEPFERGQAQAIGALLAGLHYIEPEVLSRTQEVLAQQLIEGLPADQVVSLQPRLAELFGGLVVGFFEQARGIILNEQEQTRGALITALRQTKEAVQRAYEEVEQRVQERTAELRDTNESLQREIAERKRAEEALRKARDELEMRVQERTADLAEANEALLAEIAERKRAEEELIRLSSAVKTSVDSIVIMDVEGKIIDMNEAALKMYGADDKGDLIGQHVLHYIAPEKREEGLAGIEFVLEKGYDMSRGYEVITRDGSRIPVELSAAVMKDTDGKPIGIVIIARDITERKRAEEELRDREATMRALLNAPIEAAALIDSEGIILAANEPAAKSVGKSVDEFVGLRIYDLFPPALAESRKRQVDEVFRSGSPARFEDEHEGRSLDHRLYPVSGAQGEVTRIAVYIRDITHRKQAEERIRAYQERLRSLASQLSLVEEQERRRLATALHDRIAQTLALSKIKLGVLQEPQSSTDLAQPLNEICKLLEQAIQDTRSLIFEISSPILYNFGLEAAVEWLTEQTQKRHGILSEFRDDRQPKPLDEDVRVLLFQAVRELLINVAKHAQAQSVKVAIRRDDNDIQIIIEDDGVGFDTFPIGSHWSEIKGFGLFSIRERLDYLGGQLKIKSEPGHGTQVTLVAPLKREETSKEEMA
jgi:PAS domain S-box-containing protein